MVLEHVVHHLQQAITQKDYEAAKTLLKKAQAIDAASALRSVEINTALKLLLALDIHRQVAIYKHLTPSLQADMAHSMGRKALTLLFEKMEHDDRADLYKRLSETERQALLPGLAHAEREDIRLLASYPEGTVGSVMTSAYATLRADQTIAQALETIRLEAPDMETIYQAYVLDAQRNLVGTLSLRDLLLAEPAKSVEQIMVKEVIFSQAQAPRIEAAQQIAHYDLLAVPVVNVTLPLN